MSIDSENQQPVPPYLSFEPNERRALFESALGWIFCGTALVLGYRAVYTPVELALALILMLGGFALLTIADIRRHGPYQTDSRIRRRGVGILKLGYSLYIACARAGEYIRTLIR